MISNLSSHLFQDHGRQQLRSDENCGHGSSSRQPNPFRCSGRRGQLRTPVFERQGRHEVVHFQQDVVIEADDGRHALAHGNGAPGIAVERHIAVVTELRPFSAVNAVGSEGGWTVIQPPQPTASAFGVAGGDAFFTVTVRADVFHTVFSQGRK